MHLLTDASKGTQEVSGMIGWALVQSGTSEGECNPISFESRVLTKSEQNYPTNQLEQLSVIEGYRDNYFVAYGHPTTIFCDNKPSVANATQLETRMMGKTQALVNDTGATVSYRKGDEHQVSDFFSRFKAPIIAEFGDKKIPHYYMEDIEKRYRRDKEVRRIKEDVQKGNHIHTENFKDIKDDLRIHRGLVMVKSRTRTTFH